MRTGVLIAAASPGALLTQESYRDGCKHPKRASTTALERDLLWGTSTARPERCACCFPESFARKGPAPASSPCSGMQDKHKNESAVPAVVLCAVVLADSEGSTKDT